MNLTPRCTRRRLPADPLAKIPSRMTDNFEIKSNAGPERVELKVFNRDFIEVTVTGSELSAQARVAFLGGADGLDEYWADIAENWRGWQGEKTWRSLESDLGFAAVSDRAGHVTLKVTLEYGTPWKWQTQVLLAIEAGQLDGIAATVGAFARSLGATA